MPVLPSGKAITINHQIIHGVKLSCMGIPPPPKGFYWKWRDPALSEFGTIPGDNNPEIAYMLCPLPKNIDEMENLLDFTLLDTSGYSIFDDAPLCDFQASDYLDDDDFLIWNKWLKSEPVQLAFEMIMDRCYEQVENFNTFNDTQSTSTKVKLDETFSCEYAVYIRNRDYLNLLLSMDVDEPCIHATWIDLCIEKFSDLFAWQEGENFFRKQFALFPDNEDFRYQIFRYLLNQKKYDEIESELWDEVTLRPEKTRSWELLADVYFTKESRDEAIRILNLAISKHSNNAVLGEKIAWFNNLPDWMTRLKSDKPD